MSLNQIKKYILLFVILFSASMQAQEEQTLLLSLTLGWDFGKGMVFSPSASYLISNQNYKYGFYGISYGFKVPISGRENFNYTHLHYIQLIGGYKIAIGGFGYSYYNFKGSYSFSPIASIRTGLLLYANYDMLFNINSKYDSDLGFQLGIPIPLNYNIIIGTK